MLQVCRCCRRGEYACAEAKVLRIAKARIAEDQHRVTVV